LVELGERFQIRVGHAKERGQGHGICEGICEFDGRSQGPVGRGEGGQGELFWKELDGVGDP
jgi:hypothetical protein